MTTNDLGFDHRGGSLFMSYLQVKEQMAARNRGGAFSASQWRQLMYSALGRWSSSSSSVCAARSAGVERLRSVGLVTGVSTSPKSSVEPGGASSACQ